MSLRRRWPILIRWLVLGSLVLGWQVSTVGLASPYFPPPSAIAERAADLWLPNGNGLLTPGMRRDVLPSLGRALAGFGIAVTGGIALGAAIGLSRRLEAYLDWILQFARAVPPPTLFPVLLVLLGTGDSMRIALIALGSVWPILLNTIEGVRGVGALQLEAAQVFRISAADRLFRVILPAAGPKILAGVRTSVSLALILMVISEMVASANGIGHQLVQAQRSFGILTMWAAIVLLAVLGHVLNSGLTVAERRILAWQRATGRQTA